MELKKFFRLLYKRLWIIILLPVVSASAAAFASFYLMEPLYEAKATLYVVNKQTGTQTTVSYNDILANQQLINDYREFIKSRSVTKAVIEELNLTGMSPESLAKNISVSLKNDTRIIEIKIRDNYPQRAEKLVNKLSGVFIKRVAQITKIENISIVDRAEVPYDPVMPKPFFNTAISLLTGVLAAVGIIFLQDYLNDTIRSVDDIEKYLGLPVLGTIPVLNMK